MDYFKEVNAYTMLNAINIFDEKLFNPSKKRMENSIWAKKHDVPIYESATAPHYVV